MIDMRLGFDLIPKEHEKIQYLATYQNLSPWWWSDKKCAILGKKSFFFRENPSQFLKFCKQHLITTMGPLVWYLAIKKYKYYLVWAIFLNFGTENATLGAKS